MSATDQRLPVSQLVTYELAAMRAELEHKIASLPEDAPNRAYLRDQLAEVLTEIEDRRRIRRGD